MTLDQARKAGFIELTPLVNGFAALWHVAGLGAFARVAGAGMGRSAWLGA